MILFTISFCIFTGRNEVLAKVMFLHVCVILFTGGGYLTRQPPPGPGRNPPRPDPPGTRPLPRPGRNLPWTRGPDLPPGTRPPQTREEPPSQTRQDPPGPGKNPPSPGPETPPNPRTRQEPLPPRTADSGIRSTFGRYASYWNAFLSSIGWQRKIQTQALHVNGPSLFFHLIPLFCNQKQESIPVGCVRPALNRYSGGLCQGVPPKQSPLPPNRDHLDRDPIGQRSPRQRPCAQKEHGTRQPDRKWHHTETPPIVDRMPDTPLR